MTAVIRCECGWELSADTSDELVAAMESHVAASHPELPQPPHPADVLAMIEER
jgi:Protein of unknown function (DUF1059)